MVPNQLSLTRLAHTMHAERTEPATPHPSYDDESYLRQERAQPRSEPRSLVAHLLGLARVHQAAGRAS